MSDAVKSIRSKPAPLPPAVGQFGIFPAGGVIELHAYRPSGCPSIEQFEAGLLFAKTSRPSPGAV